MPDTCNSHGLWQGEQQPTEMNADALWSRPYIFMSPQARGRY